MSLFAEQLWRRRHREQSCGHRERGGEGEMCGEGHGSVHYRVYNRQPMGIAVWLCINLVGGMGWEMRWEMGGRFKGRGYTYTCG